MGVIRVGDIVKIITPDIFVRCGYPFDQRAATEHLIDHYRADIDALIDKVDPNPKYANRYVPEADYRALCGRLARIVAQRDGFGGNERTIYTERDERLTGLRCSVMGKKIHKTGRRVPPGGEYYDEPGYLADEKTHIVLTVSPVVVWYYDQTGYPTNYDPLIPSPLMIEAIHVEKEEPAT